MKFGRKISIHGVFSLSYPACLKMRAYNGMKSAIQTKTNNTEKRRVPGEVKYQRFEATVGSSNLLFSLFRSFYRHNIG